ncbi:hypothetical protein A2803_05825 [Candidatus Woesebacteria bacterium RIFCSPHIGHO2_01_FULL_44_21]|uniref:OBG-type G domain-containing protein n=1 Tax=Candidatus Woesebacteria bacterium RIFCSPHIGHO2_01_FULL_44_21 TaxID=1802503 RepID=A0A1F7YZS2_9BACT|nr:MAG: hypothetical protein A2803_05825 [Candidatus Woesebacteria bacterium RIFCSPHIGHO2_01_FULL_44_21]OGM71171.1 MAG: hypothetical protein A2897_02600 [Candidatus Woesebacteria bacterium RIFCSPLOWO2_01_FULL_44_24b]
MQIKRIEKEIRDTPYHKGTERHIGILRARLAKLKDTLEQTPLRQGSGGGQGYALKKQGDATVVLVGPPSAGKSTLLNALTNAESKVAPYAFTTVSVIPGMMKYNDAYIQILDVPGLIEGAEEGKGRGREVLSVARGADLLVLISDVKRPEAIARITAALERNGIRIDKTPPEVKIEKKLKGGLLIKSNIKQELDKETVKEVAAEMGVKNAEIQIRQKVSLDELIDVFAKNRVYVPAISVLNKADTTNFQFTIFNFQNNTINISAETGRGLSELKKAVWDKLNLVKIYLIDKPMIVKSGISLRDVAELIGPDFAQTHDRAKIWGPTAKFEGQEVSLSTKVAESLKVKFL